MKRAKNIIFLLGFVAGFLILMYPTFSDMWNRYRNKLLAVQYEQKVESIDETQKNEILADARAYNAQHTVNEIQDVFDASEQYVLTHPYDTLLNPNGDEVMGSLEIPKIKVDLAIYHGTGSEALSKGVGHVQGTSLPVGGESTHAVLAAHRGLSSAKLFTDLDELQTGDRFFLHIMGDTLAYEVDQIEVVDPDDTSYIQIEEGQDLVTLLTCTPYGVNTQRLLVRGHRVGYISDAVADEAAKYTVSIKRDEPVRYFVSGLIAVIIVIMISRAAVQRGVKRTEKKKGRGLHEKHR